MKVWLDHIVLNVRDIERAIEFYTEVLGLAAERLAEYRDGKVLFPSIRINADTLIDLLPPELSGIDDAAAAGSANLNHFCLTIEAGQWEALEKRLQVHNVELEAGPMTLWGAHGEATAYYLRDRDGNQLEIRYY